MSGILPDNGEPIENPDPEADTDLTGQHEQENAEGEAVEAESESHSCHSLVNENANSNSCQDRELEPESSAGQVLLNGDVDFGLTQRQKAAEVDEALGRGNENDVEFNGFEQENAEDEIVEAELNQDAENVTREQEATEDDIVVSKENLEANGNARVFQSAEEDEEASNEGSDDENDLATQHNATCDVVPEMITAATVGHGFCESTQAEDDQDLNVNNSECTAAEWSLEPEDSIRADLEVYGADGAAVREYEMQNDDTESERLDVQIETHRTESESQLSGNIEEIHINSGAQGNDSGGFHNVDHLNLIENFGAASNVYDDDAWETNSLPEEEDYGPEGDRCLVVGNEAVHELLETEADQEIELSAGAAASGCISSNSGPNNHDVMDVSCPECFENPVQNSIHVNVETYEAADDGDINDDAQSAGCDASVNDHGAATLEDEISIPNLINTNKPKDDSESFEPECDQSLIDAGQGSRSSQNETEVVTENEHGSIHGIAQEGCSRVVNSSEASQSAETETLQENFVINSDLKIKHNTCDVTGEDHSLELRTKCDRSNQEETECLNEGCTNSIQTETVEADLVNQISDESLAAHSDQSSSNLQQENTSAKADAHVQLKTDSTTVLSNGQGAIPKSKLFQTQTCSVSKIPQKNSIESVENTSKEENQGVDSEDELLSELDATLKGNSDKTSLNSAIADQEEGDSTSTSCDQCIKNNLKCSLKNGILHGDNSNIPDLKTLKKQLHQAKQLLLERECEISRLKSDVEEKTVRYETLVLERDTYQKEIDCLKHQNTDDLYLPQIKELEYTIAQQQTEIRGLKDKLSSHDSAAKKAIAALQSEMKLRVDQITKNCEEATREKDAMVVKYAQAEHKNLEYMKHGERLEAKLREVEKEKEGFVGKFKAVKEHRTKIGAELEAKIAELHNVHKELDKSREQLSSADTRVKWAQNKLKAELEAHKETKVQLEKANIKIKEAKEETQQIRKDCQAMIKTYQESEEVKSNSLDKELKLKESELLAHQQQQNHTELVHVKTLRELEQLKSELAELKTEKSVLQEKISKLDTDHDQSQQTVSQYSEIIQRQKKEIAELRERIESLVHVKTDFTRAQELIKTLDCEISDLKVNNKDLVAEMDACRRRETDKMELNAKLSRKNAELQSENTTLSNKVLNLTGELQSCKMECQDMDTRLKETSDALASQQKLREEETQSLNTKLAGKCKAVEDLMRKVEEEKDEIKTLKRKHANNVKDLTRQLQQVRRKLENYEVTSNGDKDTISLGSRTSSNGSLNTVGLPEPGSSSSNMAAHTPNVMVQSQPAQHVRQPSPEQEYPLITEQVEVNKQVLIERIVKLQKTMARKNEKIEFMDDHISQLVDEIQKKNRLIQNYILREEAGTMTTESVDNMKLSMGASAKAELARKHSIMGSLYSSHSTDGTMTLDLSLEINRKLQAVLEDTLLKNMTLKESLDTLGQEIARLSQENRSLQLKFQGKHTARTKPR